MSGPESRERFAQAVASLASPQEVETLLGEVLTPAELHDLGLRWKLLERLAQGASQRTIASELGISLCKITRGARILKQPGSLSARLLRGAMPSPKAVKNGTRVARKS
ncbi:MAG: Trp family transcriptional regulator [Kiritimatiellia bacterium]